MAHGFTGTRDQLAARAARFAAAGFAVLTFDYRHFGDSAGEPRQIVSIDEQLNDWRAAIAFARGLDGIDPGRIALWGTSLSGGHVINLAAEDPTIAAVVAQVPAVDKSARRMVSEGRAKMERDGISLWSLIRVSLRSLGAGVYDALRGRVGLAPYYLPVFGCPGEAAAFTAPDAAANLARFTASGPAWRNRFAPRFLFGTPKYRPGTAERIHVPLLVCVADRDTETDPELAIDIARRAQKGELLTYPVAHFDVYFGDCMRVMVDDQVEFLRRHLLGRQG